MNFIEKNKKELVIIFVVIILALGTSMIYVILNPSLNLKEYEDTSNYFDNTDYYISNETNTYTEYTLNDLALLDLYIENFNILYKDSTLKINDKIIGENVYLYKKCALYKEAKLVLFIRHNDTERDEIVIYNTLDYTYEKLNKIDNMYINVTDNIYFEDIGFTINVTAVEDDVFIANSNYICNINDDQIINEYIEYIFDPNALEFNNYEVISSVSLVSYKSINGYC